MTERMHLYLAQGIRSGPARPEADEQIAAQAFALPELLRMIRGGRIIDGKSLVGLFYWAQWGARRETPRK